MFSLPEIIFMRTALINVRKIMFLEWLSARFKKELHIDRHRMINYLNETIVMTNSLVGQ